MGKELINAMPAIFRANPYFDDLMLFYDNTVHTSQDKYIPINCDQCEKKNLYEKRDKANKSDYINKIHALLESQKNPDWPFKEDLLIQFTVSGLPSRVKAVDLDNLAKTIFDSLNGMVYLDDAQIVAFAADKGSVKGVNAFMIAIKRLASGEKPIYQEFLFSGKKDAWNKEYEKKELLNKPTRFTTY